MGDIPVTLVSVGLAITREVIMDAIELEVWTTPDFVEYETPMEVTAYAARMED
jgi:coenzyme PQQ precursor peptide PqqA